MLTENGELPQAPDDYRNQNLSGEDFSNQVLVGADFSGSNCQGCNFTGSDLSFARFKGTNLYKADFSRAILYVTYFDSCDLSRAVFHQSYLYGAKFLGSVNVTYCEFTDPLLETYRRKSVVSPSMAHYPEVELLSPTTGEDAPAHGPYRAEDRTASELKFCVGPYSFEFEEYDAYEREMQRSQIFNRLKRVFRENHLYEEASRFYYQERRWRTRSWYFEGKRETFDLARIGSKVLRTLIAWLNEILCGYGERPFLTVSWILLATIAFGAAYVVWPGVGDGRSGLFLSGRLVAAPNSVTFSGLIVSLYYSICTLTTLGCADVVPGGVCRAITAVEAGFGVVMLALLTATVVRKFIRE